MSFLRKIGSGITGVGKKLADALRRFYKGERRERTGNRRAASLVALALLIAFALYYLGIIDFSLIDRPQSWQDHTEKTYSIWNDKTETPAETDERGEKDGKKDTSPDRVGSVEIEVHGKNKRPQAEEEIKTREALAEEGFYLTDSTYVPGTSAIGKISFSFSLPKRFSYRDMNSRTWKITTYDDGRMSTVEDTVKSERRPAVYLYMGYIIYDDRGGELYIIDKNGAVLNTIDESLIPAYARDTYGRPLFFTPYNYYADVPDTETVNEAGESEFTYRGAYLSGKNYYALYQGGYIYGVDYVEERDGRGLNFDFIPSYGLSDTYNKYRAGIASPKYSSFLDGSAALVTFMNWNYFSPYDPETPDVNAIVEAEKAYALLPTAEKLAAIENKTTPEDIYHISEKFPYLAAFNYNEGYATVVTSDVDEEPKYEATELRVVNTSGEIMFTSRKKYSNPEGAFCSDRYMLPLSRGEESVGHLYFDHGLMRIRKVSFDKFQLDEYGDFRVNSDVDVLVYPNGTEFPIPDGYTLKGYSDGILTLERNGLYGYMRYDGSWIAEATYKNAAAFHGGIGVLTKPDGTVGAVDTNGSVVIPFKYTYVSNRSDSLISAYSNDGGWELFGVFEKQ